MVSSYLLIGQPAFAEKQTKPPKVIEAEEFRLVDRFGTRRAELKIDEYIKTPVLYMYDRKGRRIAEVETVDPDPH